MSLPMPVRSPGLALGVALLLSVAAGSALGQDDPGAVDPALLQEIEQAVRLERELRESREAEARAERAAEEQARLDAEEAKRTKRAAEEGAYESQISEQQEVQHDLLWAATGRGKPRDGAERTVVESPAGFDPAGIEPRTASRAPQERDLPLGIFDREDVDIASGTWGNEEALRLRKLSLDADGDGKLELVRYVDPQTGEIIRQEEDRNYDGMTDAWSEYRSGRIVLRVLDGNDDGNPDAWEHYRDGRLSLRELDRDDDGVRDVFYRYSGDSLVQEKHDSNNDGKIDLVISYEGRLRVRAEEDLDRDGRIDTWTIYVSPAGSEQVSRIERDKNGRGFADTFEVFETRNGKATLTRREEDMNGDGKIDIVSFYENGKLRRRQISNPDAVPL
jgi:antitoxin component YwqK of YwqJK toxin-antitoxin module